MSGLGTPLRVLIADDDSTLRAIAHAVLSNAGYAVTAVPSGDAAVAACTLAIPDLVLLDVDMPDGDGHQACANIRALPGGMHVPIVMVTGLDDSRSIHRAYEGGATDFIVKPINWALLEHRLRYVLRGARTLEDLRLSEQKNAALLTAIPDGIFLVTAAGRVVHRFSAIPNSGGEALASLREPTDLLEVVPAAVREKALRTLGSAIAGKAGVFEFCLRESGRAPRYFECRCLPQSAERVLAIVRDVTARRETEAHIHRLAYFDALTTLPNREWIGEYLGRALTKAGQAGKQVGLLYVDLDQFKRINDTLGHQTGDALLRQVAERLQTSLALPRLDVDSLSPTESLVLPPDALALAAARLARVGGDEFIIVLPCDRGIDVANTVAQRIIEALSTPFLQNGYELVVTPSIGIAMYPEHGADAPTLLKNADGAMYEAKAAGRNQFRVCNSALEARALKRLSLEMELRKAFDAGALEVYYQPKYATDTLKLTGGEALLRWFHPERGQIPTGDFIAVAEETGLISDIGRWTLGRVCRDLGRWQEQGLAVPRVAVNVSGRDFIHPESLLRLAGVVTEARLSPSLFELELTEGVLMQDAEAGRRALTSLKEFGFALAVDDFGTGYCSLGYLKRFPLDTLKIDRSFVKDIGTAGDDGAIARAIVALGHSLGLRIVAEGVETAAQLHFLRLERCDAIQGFLMSAAVPAADFAAMLRPTKAAAAAGPVEPIRRAG